ncbi:MAG: HVO_0476 family zinc finger protein [Pseudomonadota bacterium]
MKFFERDRLEVDCKVIVVNTFDSLEAHLELPESVKLAPGDEVLVHGRPIEVPYGETQSFDRRATVTRASKVERMWTKATGDLEYMELLEFSFSEEALS